jgi:hypothetical protein
LIRFAAAPGMLSVRCVARMRKASIRLKAGRMSLMKMYAAATISAMRTIPCAAFTPIWTNLAISDSTR